MQWQRLMLFDVFVCAVGNPHSLGTKPKTFTRQVRLDLILSNITAAPVL